MNHYHTLGLEENCTPKQIKSQYRKLALKYHPDKHKGNHTYAEQFFKVQQAYDVLINHQSRAEYDQLNNTYTQKTDNFDNNANDIREEITVPNIILFRCDKVHFDINEVLTFEWKTSGADYIEIRPFGKVSTLDGKKKIKIKQDVATITVKIIAKNSKSGEFVTKSIFLEKKSFSASSGSLEQPDIISFEFNKNSKDGKIELTWVTSNAESVEIIPFGKVAKTGTQQFTITSDLNMIKIIATNNTLKMSSSKELNIKNKIVDSENEKMSFWGWFLVFILIAIAILGIFSVFFQAVSFLTGNDYYESDAFFSNTLPYLGITIIAIFIYVVNDSNK